MGIFDNIADTTGQLKDEGRNVQVTFLPGVPNAGQGTITWNIPGPVVESTDANGNVVITADPTGSTVTYGGIVLVLKDQPVDHHNIPKDGVVYVADPTANVSLFSGDRIGDALVIGAFYESELKSQGKALTTSLVLNDIDPTKQYFICGYILDDQLRYFTEGSRAYSDRLGKADEIGAPARQAIQLGPNPVTGKFGVYPTDGTGLLTGATYMFEVIYDCDYPHVKGKEGHRDPVKNMFVRIKGEDAPTYDVLVKLINQQLSIQCTNAVQSPVPPGAGTYYWNGTSLCQWNGTACIPVTNIVISPTDPAMPALNSYWWNTTNNKLYQWNGSSYQLVVPQLAYPTDPTQIVGPNNYWWNGSEGFTRCGDTWCETTTFNTTTDPSCPVAPVTCSYWYDTANSTLYTYSNGQWIPAYALMWPVAPNALPNGSYWFDLNTSTLHQRQYSGPINITAITANGSGYTDGTYTNVPLAGGHGANAQATIVVAGGVVSTVTITNPGINYFVGDILTLIPATVGGTGTGATITVSSLAPLAPQSWLNLNFINSTTDPFLVPANGVVAGTYWYNPTTEVLSQRNVINTAWNTLTVLVWAGDPTLVSSCELWWNESTTPPTLNKWDIVNNRWDDVANMIAAISSPVVGSGYTTGTYNNVPLIGGTGFGAAATMTVTSGIVTYVNITDPGVGYTVGDVLTVTNTNVGNTGSGFSVTVTAVSGFYIQATNPYGTPTLATGTLWWNQTAGALLVWNGSAWVVANAFTTSFDPTIPVNGEAWLNTTTNTWYIWGQPKPGQWNAISPVVDATDPSMPAQGSFWFDTATNVLYQRVGMMWIPIPYVTKMPTNGRYATWYNILTNQLMEWNGTMWLPTLPCVYCKLEQGHIVFVTTGRGSNNVLFIPVPTGVPNMLSGCLTFGTGALDYFNDGNSPYDTVLLGSSGVPSFIPGVIDGTYGQRYRSECFCAFAGFGGLTRYHSVAVNPNAYLWSNLTPKGNVLPPMPGEDGVSGTNTTNEIGIGTDGSPDERRNLYKLIRIQLGYPTITVELDDTQLDRAVQNSLETFRQRSSMAYKRACFFLDIRPFEQNYILANKAVGFNKIVTVMAGYRFTSAFLSSAYGSGVYGQVVLQHLYNMGTFDLLSYHLVSSYVEQLEILFSTRLVFVFDEYTRKINFFQTFNRPERVLLDVTVERTEQDIFTDRYAKRWIQQFAVAEAMDMLAQIRGKFASLPGAGGSVTLNAADLRTQAEAIRVALYQELDDNIVQDVEDYGAYGSIAIG